MEPGAAVCVVETGPVVAPEVFDILPSPWAAATEVVWVALVFAAEAALAPPLQPAVAAVARTNETRAERYIFPSCC
jgi:hypothetical protein